MRKNYDCVVVGGGIAGVSAALSLSRDNLDVLLVEKQCILGGLATSGLINWYEPICSGKGEQLIYGIAEELLKLAAEYGASLDQDWLTKGKGNGRYATFFDHNIFAAALTCLLTENGVDLTFDTLLTDVVVDNHKIKAVKLHTIDGEETVVTKYVIDATGTAKVFDLCKLPLRDGSNYLSYYVHRAHQDSIRVWDIYGANMFGVGQPEDFDLLTGKSATDINRFIIKSHQVFYSEVKNNNRGQDVTAIPHMPQFRMIRSIVGEETISNNLKNSSNINSVGVFGYFAQPGNYFELPYGSLFNSKIGNLFAAGRIISATGEGWDASRVIPVAALTGEVAAKAISLLINDKNANNYDLDVTRLQNQLVNNGHKIRR